LKQVYDSVQSLNEIGAFEHYKSSSSDDENEDVELCDAILDKLSLINIEELSWKDPVASLVLDENSNLIKPLDKISLQQLS
ncbi:976_t:CDS:2, partial [Rhizophagus irregularis]